LERVRSGRRSTATAVSRGDAEGAEEAFRSRVAPILLHPGREDFEDEKKKEDDATIPPSSSFLRDLRVSA
jgi:hypothetical protein